MPSNEEISAANFGSGVQKPRRNKFNGKRAIRACDTCRRLKTRCILSPVPNEFYCLRCESLKIRCSFQDILGNANDDFTSLDGSESSPSKNVSHGSNEVQQADKNALKMLIKHGYGPQDVEITSKLLHSINANVVKVLDILQNGNGTTISNNASSARDRDSSASTTGANGFVNSSLLEAVKMVSSVSAPVERLNPHFDKSLESSPDLSSSLFTTEQRHISPYLTSPYTLLCQMVSKENLPIPIRTLYDHSFHIYQSEPVDDIITMKLITLEEAICLIGDFRDRYGAWCSFSASLSTEQLVSDIRSKDGSLLVSTTCVLALRYTENYHDLKTRVYKNLLYKLKSDLELALKIMPQSTEFLQAIVILSLYASSFSSDIMSLDAWYISGIGLQQYLTANVQDALLSSLGSHSKSHSNGSGKHNSNSEFPFFFGLRNDQQDLNPTAASSLLNENDEMRNFMSFRLWNHLCLAHVTHCVYSGRMCVIDEVRLDLSRRILQLPNATNFDGRMVGEIALQLILYNFMQKCNEGSASSSNATNALENVKDDLHEWLEEWNYLFTQPITQFLEFAYHYGYTMVLYTWHHRIYRISQRNHDDQRRKKSYMEQEQHQSEKTFIGTYLNHLYPIEEIIKSMPSDKQIDLLTHSHKALRSIIKTEYSKFKYLSDQLFFSSVLSALICVAASYNLALENKNLNKVDEILIDVKTLSLRLQQIRSGELKSFWVEEVDLKIPSVILQYHKAIESYLHEKFPAFQLNPDE